MFYVLYNGFYVSDFIALCWATFSAFYALLSSHVMTNKDDDDKHGRQSNATTARPAMDTNLKRRKMCSFMLTGDACRFVKFVDKAPEECPIIRAESVRKC